MSLHRKLSVSGVVLGTLLFTRILPAQNPAADLVLIHGHILTVVGEVQSEEFEALRRQSLTPGMLLARVSCNLWPFRFPTSVSGFWVVAFEHLLDALDRALQFVDQIFIGSGEQIGQ
jgi:hypothetical protein